MTHASEHPIHQLIVVQVQALAQVENEGIGLSLLGVWPDAPT
jgi:hypothetical protein